jgi:hypothetical protein
MVRISESKQVQSPIGYGPSNLGSKRDRPESPRTLPEQAGYFEVPGAHLYTVLHEVDKPFARILLLGAFASERHSSYGPWVRWARYLAARGVECLRLDYRGMGESTGVFEETTFEHWIEDSKLLAAWLKIRRPQAPLVLHGLELGALLAAEAFAANVGDAFLSWAAPNNANDVLRGWLIRRVAMDNMFRYPTHRKSAAEYIRRLETGPIEVDGYELSGKLWRDSSNLKLPPGMQTEGNFVTESQRPFRMIRLGNDAAPLVKGYKYDTINPDLGGLFAANFQWIAKSAVFNG